MNSTQLSESPSTLNKIVKVRIEKGNSSKKEFYFDKSFTVGRSEECSIQIDEGVVSRVHLEINFDGNKWWITDKQSSNGTFLNGKRIQNAELKATTTLELGENGPVLLFSFEEKPDIKIVRDAPHGDQSVTSYIHHYFDESKSDDQIGEHTRLMREAFKVVKKKHSSKYIKVIIIVGIIAAAAAAYSIYQNIKENKQKELAENIFYNMKSLELEIELLKQELASSGDPKINTALRKFDERKNQLERNYDNLVDALGTYNLSPEDKLIIKTARLFGECELTMPKDFLTEVKNYINKWKSSDRLQKALERAKQYGYSHVVVNYLIRQGLPPQFFYLALQESDFKEQIVGPQTRYGFAKGIWQFIPATAQKYGLTIGPLANQNVYDPGDDRFNFPKATSAASRYIRDIYNTDAQASGLLVMASYNWGEYNIIDLIRKIPANPKDRNFWNLLSKYRDKIPDETYNYVFYIFSAAVIGENPALFGFNFPDPLKDAIQSLKN
ncbi:MAG TPA: FHA domain-containing protein [Ignavibacteriaceae bacterium]|nr:FHA domain-containing protein [Ignavibacteriaceae bacterium]